MRRHAVVGVSALLFAASVAATVGGSVSMSAMGQLPMAGGWALSSMWMPMCGQGWVDAAASFVGMWAVMMVAMMLPSLAPMLSRVQGAHARRGAAGAGASVAWTGAGYLVVWCALGLLVFALGAALAQVALRMPEVARAAPSASAVVVLLAGASQFSQWKSGHLACISQRMWCTALPLGAHAAWRQGVRLGLHCCRSCAGLTAVLLVHGVMDLHAMGIVTAAITAERLAPAALRMPRVIGWGLIGIGLHMLLSVACPH
jgi:predicted metal-binding membrane protein